MDASEKKVLINPDLCIGCGNCIAICHHEARQLVDDTGTFFSDLKRGDKIIAVVAPAVASVFPGQHLKLNGYFKSIGVEAFFDVSLGAELTVISYLNYIKAKEPRMVIAQPCPAIVSYIEIYHPELIPYLAPADSPMLHTVKMIREYFPQYKDYKIAVISPCIAKRREFDETGHGEYNVTMLALKKYLQDQNIDLSSKQEVAYTGILAERAVQFSSPGGLLDTAERFVPGIRRNTRKIEGIPNIYPYLTEIAELLNEKGVEFPLLIDCLNCEKGCNGGSGTGNHAVPLDKLEGPIRKRSAEHEKQIALQNKKNFEKYHQQLNRFWKRGLYDRSYRNLSGNLNLKHPDQNELTEIYHKMKKYEKSHLYDCGACGYGSCKGMGTAIFNGINKPENCAHYNLAVLKEKKDTEELNRMLREHIGYATNILEGINTLVDELHTVIDLQAEAVDRSSAITGQMITALKDSSKASIEKQEEIRELIENASQSKESMRETIQSVDNISQSVGGIAQAIKIISAIAANTNLLSMNAAIEAAHAGEAGRGFAVVAGEIRRLSESTRENSQNISKTLKNIINGITVTSKQSGDTNGRITEMSKEIHGLADTMTNLINTLSELSSGSDEITAALNNLRNQSGVMKTNYAEILTKTNQLHTTMLELSNLSEQNQVPPADQAAAQ
jgi:iron only hydrogenase large subunit-like protein/ABC-type transporter Mla subunit MlaD